MSCASLGDAARSLVCCQASLVRGRVPRESAALYLWRAALLVRCRVDSAATPSSSAASMASSSAASTWNALHAQATARGRDVAPPPRHRADAAHRKKKTYSFDLLEEYTRKTDGRRRPMPQQIWKGPEIKITDAPPRRLTSAAGAHDAWETARPLRHD
mmetsp:Transcript_5699/g.13787  ORF Transcript_5699/g.13787 Transcript_5699/m.13787 type:complete len:158 (-) Transcript_5699:13-486(-)